MGLTFMGQCIVIIF